MKKCWLLPALALIAAVHAKEPAKAPPPPPDFPKLVALYKDFGLPQPPADAPLVSYESGGTTSGKDGKQRKILALGFLLTPPKDPAPAKLLVGPFIEEAPAGPPTWKPFRTDRPNLEGIDLNPFISSAVFETNRCPAMAVQCFQRGHEELARKLMTASAGVLNRGGPSMVSAGGEWMKHREQASYVGRPGDHPEVLLGGTAWSYWLNQIVKPQTDLKTAHTMMAKVLTTIPELNDEPRKSLLASLAASVEPTKAAPGTIEAAIDDLVNCTRRSGTMAVMEAADTRYEKILLKGFDAVPALIRHLDDKRLTRSVMVGFNNFPTMPVTVGELASQLLGDIIAEPGDGDWLNRQLGETMDRGQAELWWRTAKETGEEAYLIDHIFPSSPEATFPHGPHLEIIASKYPQRLPEVYRKLLDEHPKLQSWDVVKTIAASNLPADEMLRLFRDGASRKNLLHQRPALEQLNERVPDEANAILIGILRKLPKKTVDPVWRAEESGISHLVMKSTSKEVWAAFAETCKRSHVSLRLELLEPLNYPYVGDWQLQQRVNLLRQFLDDTTERVIKENDEIYEGPSAAFHFPKITVRDFASMQLGSLLKIKEKPDKKWTAKQWTDFRAKVRAALPPASE